MDVVPIHAALEDAWDAFVRRARNGHFFFERRFMTYHADRFAEASLVVMHKGEIVGLLPANRQGETVYSHQGLTFGGLLVDDAGALQVLEMLDACADHLQASGVRRLVYKPAPWIYHRRPAQEDLYWLYRRDATLVRRDVTSAVRLAEPGAISTLRRRGAAKAQRAGVRYQRSQDFAAYWSLLGAVLAERHDVKPVHSVAEIVRLAEAFPDQISLQAALDAAGRMLAGVVVFQTASVAHAQYIAVDARGREVGALDGLVAHLLMTVGPQVTYFNFGISNGDGDRGLNEGLIRQKEGFGASTVVHDHYEVELD